MAITRAKAEQDGQLGGGCPELRNKEKVDWEQLEGAVITVAGFVLTHDKEGKELYAVWADEYPESFMWAGTALTGWIRNYGDEFIGTKVSVGGMGKTKAGRNCRKFDIVD